MDDRDRLLGLVQRLYDAPGTVDGWPDFLQQLTDATGATGASFVSHDFLSKRGGIVATSGFDPAATHEYEEHWFAHDPWAHNSVIPTLASGTVILGEALAPQSRVVRTPYYNEFGRQNGIARCIAGMIEVQPHAFSCLTINATERHGPFGSHDVVLLEALMPHLRRAIQIHRRLSEAETLTGGFKALLDRLPHGVFLLNASGRIMHANNAAEELLRRNDGLHVCRGEIRTERPSDTTKLLRLITGVLRGGTSAGGLVVVNRPSGRQPLRLLVAPASHERGVLGTESPAVLVFVSDPERQPVSSCDHLRQLFGFTAAEGRVAMAMLDGESVGTLADRLGVSRNTARTHVQRLLAKTDTRRQAELMRVLLGAQLPLRLD